ncbi:hypothetical protein G7081_07160 [Vagococcus coleopterorum]|uniref:Uncharacterized protein n=1 Tax=Vagococcus coleopterorum TaxID=2714946 RepID=A0A6G8APK4_9ENTE|nr:hypothetical protein [Vagococcus coleopterorum]QIL46865.1 hypothetical protein G7081_07160 [Vagococcus coleopterorum]
METYIKMAGCYLSARLYFDKEGLTIYPYGHKKQRIDLDSIFYLASHSVLGGQQIRFVASNQEYILYTQGEGMKDYFEKGLGVC